MVTISPYGSYDVLVFFYLLRNPIIINKASIVSSLLLRRPFEKLAAPRCLAGMAFEESAASSTLSPSGPFTVNPEP